MDLEQLVRACWRHRVRVVLAMVIGAIVLAGGAALLVQPQHTSSTDVSVSPVSFSFFDDQTTNVYTQNPDRYVATQVEVLSARDSERQVAEDLDISVRRVDEAVSVAQVGTSDVIRVRATTDSSKLSEQIASALVDRYLLVQQRETSDRYDQAQALVDRQLTEVAGQVATLTDELLQSALDRQASLFRLGQEIRIQRQVTPTSATVVSAPTVDTAASGTSTSTFALYGAGIGLALALAAIALTTRPGDRLAAMSTGDVVDGAPVLGTLSSERNRDRHAVPAQVGHLGNLSVAEEIAQLVDKHGSVEMVVVGPAAATRKVKRLLPSMMAGSEADDGSPAFTVGSLETAIEQAPVGGVVVGVDVDSVTPAQLDEVLSGLTGLGVDVQGIVGIR